jgi:hypothetical protein
MICMPGFRRKFFCELPLRSVCEIAMRVRKGQRIFDSAAVAKKIGQCDLLLPRDQWTSPSLGRLLRLLSPKLSVGLLPPLEVILQRTPTEHAMDTAFRVPAYLDSSLRADDFAFPSYVPARVRPRLREFLKRAARGKRILAIHNESKQEKIWPRERLNKLVANFWSAIGILWFPFWILRSPNCRSAQNSRARLTFVGFAVALRLWIAARERTFPGRGFLHAACGGFVARAGRRAARAHRSASLRISLRGTSSCS